MKATATVSVSLGVGGRGGKKGKDQRGGCWSVGLLLRTMYFSGPPHRQQICLFPRLGNSIVKLQNEDGRIKRTSLVPQGLRIRPPMQKKQV